MSSARKKIWRLRKRPDRLSLRQASTSESSTDSDAEGRKRARPALQANIIPEDDHNLHARGEQPANNHSNSGSTSNGSAHGDSGSESHDSNIAEDQGGVDQDVNLNVDHGEINDANHDSGNELQNNLDVRNEENHSDHTIYDSESSNTTNEESDVENGEERSDQDEDEEEEEEEEEYEEEDIVEENRPLFNGAPISLHESMMAILTLITVHSLTGKCVNDILDLIAMHCPLPNLLKNTLFKFKKYFEAIGKTVIKRHYFCSGCFHPLENMLTICELCEGAHDIEYFIEMPILSQLQKMFLRTGFYGSLQFRFNRQKKDPNNIEDIYDGRLYQEQFQEGQFLSYRNNMSFMWYSDGVAIFRGSSKYSVWPIFLVINELSYKERVKKENILLAGLWFGKTKPRTNLFLNPFRTFFTNFSLEGHLFTLPEGNEIRVKGKLLCGTCDYQAKSMFMKFKAHNGYYGCCKCISRGERLAGRHVHRYHPNIRDRQHDEILACVEQARQTGRSCLGVKGFSFLYDMVPDFIRSLGIDIMHGVFIGVFKLLVSLWFDPMYSQTEFSLRNVVQLVDERLKKIRPPSFVQRMPRSIESDLPHWKASEYKLFMLYYSIPVFKGIMLNEYYQHYIKLVSAIYLLCQNSVSLADIETARQLLHSFVAEFANLYGLCHLGINVHQLLHLPDAVLDLGPLWVYSCFFLEGLNGYLSKLYHGTRYVGIQICSSMSTFQNLHVMINNLNEGTVRKFCERLTSDVSCLKRREEVPPIGSHCFTIGKYTYFNVLPQFVQQAMETSMNLFGGKYHIFHKLRKKGVTYAAESYTRSQKKLSSYAMIIIGDSRKLCTLNYFLRRTDCNCNNQCECLPSFYAVGSVYNPEYWEVHDIPNVRLSYLSKVTPTNEFIAFSVNNIVSLCFFLKVNDEVYICNPVNSLEVE